MKALVLSSESDSPRLQLREMPKPSIGERDVLLKVSACGVCYHDVAVVDGTLRRGIGAEVVLGHEVSGIVAEVGSAVTSLRPGDRAVAALTAFCGECDRCAAGNEYRCRRGEGFGHALNGGFAQYMRVPQSSLMPLPDAIDPVEAALLACPLGVAVNALQDVARLQPEETVLVVGAGGGLGIHLAQVAASMKARVIAVTSNPEKLAALDSLEGVEAFLDDGELDFSEIALALTDDIGADVVVNPVGSTLFGSCLASVAQYGRIVVLGEIVGRAARVPLAELLFRDASVVGATGASPRHIRTATELVASGKVQPMVSQQFSFHEASDAIDRMRAAATLGRVVLIPPSTG